MSDKMCHEVKQSWETDEEFETRRRLESQYSCSECFTLGMCEVPQTKVAPVDSWSNAKGNIETASGQRYHFEHPDPDVVTLEDIAHALSNICRFGGHVRRFYSVAEHSVLVSRIVQAGGFARDHQLAAFLHDGHEAYVWDAPSPLKPLLGDSFKDLADIADGVIAAKFLPSGWEADAFKKNYIKRADRLALVVEGRALLPNGPSDKEWEPLPAGVPWAAGLDPREAEREFLQRAKELGL